jgi:hypothetical protein
MFDAEGKDLSTEARLRVDLPAGSYLEIEIRGGVASLVRQFVRWVP